MVLRVWSGDRIVVGGLVGLASGSIGVWLSSWDFLWDLRKLERRLLIGF